MKVSTLTLISSAMTAAAIAVAPAAYAGPTVQQLCDAQTWPRPVPDLVGMMFEPVGKQIPAGMGGGALACWDNVRGVTQDGYDASKEMGGWDRITAISPPPGTPVGRHDPITVQLAPIDYRPRHREYRAVCDRSLPVDAAAEYAMYSGENATAISGLGLAAQCLTNLHGPQGRPYNQMVVLLDDNRLFEAEGLDAEPCDVLKQFAQTAIGRL